MAVPCISPTSTPLTWARVPPLCAPHVSAPSLAPSAAVPRVPPPLSAFTTRPPITHATPRPAMVECRCHLRTVTHARPLTRLFGRSPVPLDPPHHMYTPAPHDFQPRAHATSTYPGHATTCPPGTSTHPCMLMRRATHTCLPATRTPCTPRETRPTASPACLAEDRTLHAHPTFGWPPTGHPCCPHASSPARSTPTCPTRFPTPMCIPAPPRTDRLPRLTPRDAMPSRRAPTALKPPVAWGP